MGASGRHRPTPMMIVFYLRRAPIEDNAAPGVGVKVRGIEVFQQRFDAWGAIGQVLNDQRSQHQALGALMCIQQTDITFGHSSEKQLRSVYTEVE